MKIINQIYFLNNIAHFQDDLYVLFLLVILGWILWVNLYGELIPIFLTNYDDNIQFCFWLQVMNYPQRTDTKQQTLYNASKLSISQG